GCRIGRTWASELREPVVTEPAQSEPEPEPESLRETYAQICESHRAIVSFRAKLLGVLALGFQPHALRVLQERRGHAERADPRAARDLRFRGDIRAAHARAARHRGLHTVPPARGVARAEAGHRAGEQSLQ